MRVSFAVSSSVSNWFVMRSIFLVSASMIDHCLVTSLFNVSMVSCWKANLHSKSVICCCKLSELFIVLSHMSLLAVVLAVNCNKVSVDVTESSLKKGFLACSHKHKAIRMLNQSINKKLTSGWPRYLMIIE